MSNQVAEPIEGETLATYRKRNNLPGTATHLAENTRWSNGAWISGAITLAEAHRGLRLAWVAADKKVAHLVDKKPDDSKVPNWTDTSYEASEARSAHRDALREWNAEWNEALGFREGLQQACAIAGVEGFAKS